MIEEFKVVALTEDLPLHGLQKGDIGTVVFVYQEGEAYEVEFITFEGETVAVVTVNSHQLRQVGSREIAQSRVMAV